MAEIRIPAAVAGCRSRLEDAGYPAYLVGGCVRDLLLGRIPADYDLTTAARPEQVMELFERTVPTGLKHGTVTVLTADGPVEVTTFRREEGYADGRHPDRVSFDAGLFEDLARRDFTVNAMAMDGSGAVTDPWEGRTDLEHKVIRCVGEPDARFAEDALRMLRAIRFAAQLGFSIDAETAAALARNADRTALVSRERIRMEMEKTLLSPRPEEIGRMLRLGLLAHLCPVRVPPDLTSLRSAAPAPAPRWAAFCAATGFPLEALPVERSLKRAVLHPEADAIRRLALSGGEIAALGLRGEEIGAAQKQLAAHILSCPGDNTRERLLELLEGTGDGCKTL